MQFYLFFDRYSFTFLSISLFRLFNINNICVGRQSELMGWRDIREVSSYHYHNHEAEDTPLRGSTGND